MSIGTAYVGRIMINIITERQTDKLWVLISAMVGMLVLSLVLSSVNSYISARISIYVNNDIQAGIFEKIMDARWRELSTYPSGDLLNRFNGDVGTIASNAINWIPNLIINIYTFIVTLVVLWRMDAGMAIIAFVSAPFLLGLSRFIMRRMKEYRKRVLELNSRMMSFEVETFYNFEMIKSFGIFGYYSRKLHAWQQRYKEFNLDYNNFQIKSNILLTLVSTLVSSTAFAYCLYRLWTGQILYGDMTFFLQQRSALSAKFNNLVGTIPGMINSAVSAHRVRELMDLPREEHDEESVTGFQGVLDSSSSISLSVDDVSFAYDERASVYDHASFRVSSGEIVAVMAESGGGKTTLIRLLLGMLEPSEGKVVLKGSSGEEFPVNADLRRFFAYVPQGNTMFSGSIADNMRMVNESASDEDVMLKTACAWDFVKELPLGINSVLGERGRGLSEGQSQRISIARALLRGAPVLLFDEATSALDTETEEQVLYNIMSGYPDKVIILSTHRPAALKLCSRIYKIAGGGIREVTIEEALMIPEQLLEKKSYNVNDNYMRLSKPMAPQDPANAGQSQDGEEGWWNL